MAKLIQEKGKPDRLVNETKHLLVDVFKRGGGAPKKYADHKVLLKKMVEYLEAFDNWSIEGLAVYLGFSSRQSIYDLEKQGDEFSYILKKLRAVMASKLAEDLDDKSKATVGLIFHLKQLGWKDTIEQTNIDIDRTGARDFGDNPADS